MLILNESGEFSSNIQIQRNLKENREYKIYDSIINTIAGEFAEGSLFIDLLSGKHRVLNIVPNSDVVNKVLTNIEANGFNKVDSSITEDDEYIVYTKETDGMRIVFELHFNYDDNFAYVTCGYDDKEDSEYFEESKKSNSNSTKLTEAVDNVVISSEFFDLVKVSGVGMNNTPWSGLRVNSKGKAEEHVVEIRLDSKDFYRFTGEPVRYEYRGAYVSYGLTGSVQSDEQIREFINVLEEALKFKAKVLDYINDVYSEET